MNEIPGLFYIENVIQDEPIPEDWIPITDSEKSRRVQHYGYKYNYMTGEPGGKCEPFPKILKKIKKCLKNICKELGIYNSEQPFNSCIINEYLPGQGISPHCDHYKYGDVIGCFTLGSGADMVFTPRSIHAPRKIITIHPKPGSLYIMSGESRRKWKHCMPARKGDKIDGKRIVRERRISITFRYSPP